MLKKNIRRTPYQAIAATLAMFLTFLALSAFLLIALGSQQILKFYESKPQAIAFFKDSTSQADIDAIQNSLSSTGRITNFKYVSKEEALQIYRERNKNNPMLLELVTANILPSSLEISAQTPEDLKPIADVLKQEPVVEEVVFPEDVVEQLAQATKFIRFVGGSIVGFLITFSTIIIVMIISFKIRLKREEIETMKLLGASTWFIRLPFILEGMIYTSLGAFLGWGLSYATVWYIEPLLINSSNQFYAEIGQILLPISPLVMLQILLAQVAVAIVVGGLGSLAAIRRYLHL